MTTVIVNLLGVLALIAAFAAYVATKPGAFRIERAQRIHGSCEAVFTRINDLRAFNSWNPFAAADPTAKIDYFGPSSGMGAVYDWVSTGRSGQGRVTVVESRPPYRVVMRLDFLRPFVAINTAEFSISSERSVTTVSWAMTGTYGVMQKLFGTFFDMDKMMGREFAKGLASLKTLVETEAAAA